MKPISLYEFGAGEDEIRKMQKPWVDYFRHFGPVLDIGCGRGVFLELLAAAGIEVAGVDHSEEALAACREKGFQVHFEDAHSFLRHNPAKFGGIFCSHVIEHMPYADATALLELCHQALLPGGRLLLITPNPEDLAVISEIFWLDPTHVRPYPRLLLKAMLKAVGFQIKVENQFPGTLRLDGRRRLPIYLLRRLLLGKYYGKPNTLVLAQKDGDRQFG